MNFGLSNYDCRDIFCRDFAQKVVAVEFFTANGKEQITRFCLTRISADIFHQSFRRAAPDFCVTGFGDKFQRTFFHKIQRETPAATSAGFNFGGCKFSSAGMFK